jgi:hypothetical protein
VVPAVEPAVGPGNLAGSGGFYLLNLLENILLMIEYDRILAKTMNTWYVKSVL